MIQIKNIVKNYYVGDMVVPALKDVSINFREKEFVSILGPSGCGKTTLLNVLGGLDRFDGGEILINRESTKNFKDKDWDSYRNHHIGFVFQSYNLIPHLSVLENVEIALSIAGLNRKEKKSRAIAALEKVGLKEQINKKPNQLSGGQMQRVAIARAIVNNPKIILADEPTGALDSDTSVQIMNLLKEIAGNHLIIMVTHNQDLANEYSTRIIKLLDGNVIDDSNPFVLESENNKCDNESQYQKQNIEKIEKTKESKDKNNKKVKKQKSAMGFLTAIHLSLKNLITKKGRTFMTSFAGSIGIIGIALVLAVSNGFTMYIENMQSNTLSSYPVTISTITVNMQAIEQRLSSGLQKEENVEFPSEEIVNSYSMATDLAEFSQYNFLSPKFIEYMKEYESEDAKKVDSEKTLNDVEYSYASSLPVYTKNANDEIIKVKSALSNSVLGGDQSGAFTEGLSNSEFVMSKYDVLKGDYPQNKTDLALVVDEYNRVSRDTLIALGIDDTTKTQYTFKELIGKEYKVLLNDAYYNNSFTPITDQTEITNLYNSTDNENVITCKISCILRIKKDIPTSLYGTGIKYSSELTKYCNEKNRESKIVKAQLLNTETFIVPYEFGVKELGTTFTFYFLDHENPNLSLKKFVKNNYDVDLTIEQLQEYGLQMLGASTIPVSIKLYPTDFDAKDQITKYISNWNATEQGKNNQIIYSDTTAFLTNTMGQMVDIISYVLIAFASISLVVSSIMISIITYVSVIERTKEIGVLRSIGARKKDISRVFNAETLLIGLCAGILGVVTSFVLTIPINAIIVFATNNAVSNIAVLAPTSALALVIISVALTIIAGFVPSKMAAKKDPVKALRTE